AIKMKQVAPKTLTAVLRGNINKEANFTIRDSQHFFSYPSSTPVTTKCEEITVKMFGRRVRVVDTPDFFYEDQPVDEEEIKACKQYCKSGQHVILLVIQLGRFTDGEAGILEKLENKFGRISDRTIILNILENLEKSLGWRIRDSTIILFTHGEDLKGSVDKFIGERSYLKRLVEACSNRYHFQLHLQRMTRCCPSLLCLENERKQDSSQCDEDYSSLPTGWI
uniref:AIG1-type G domain-containing protein n=1 Tax=Neolamprologus brichardi TaxID=32507 RepID=A0A3Q4G7V0_NEOBR